MSTRGVPSAIDLWWSTRRSRLLLFAIHVPFLLVPALLTATGLEGPAESVWIVAALTIAIAAVALRHSFAAAEGGLPA
jgi:hypothetical protein